MQKKTKKAAVELQFYKNIPERHRPKNLMQLDDGIQYERVTGIHPASQEDWDKVWKVGVKTFWLGLDCELTDSFYTWCGKYQTCREDLYKELHPVRLLHGCPRAEHIIIEHDGQVVFISPHEPEIVCREWDEAYLLMSIVTLWESWTRSWSVDHFRNGMRPELIPPFEVTDVHKMFLLSHWRRERGLSHRIKSAIFPLLEKDWNHVDLRATMIEMVCE